MKHKRLAALLSLLLALLLVPSRAYADARFGYVGLLDGVQCHNDYNDFENFLVFAPDKYAAAVMAVGGDVNSLTAAQKLKLSDSNYGGAFYDYSQTFHEMQGTTFPDFVPTYIVAALMIYYSPIPNGLSYFAPESEFYYSVVSPEIYTAAKAAYLAVINGEDTGGSDGGGGAFGGTLPDSVSLDTPYGVTGTGFNWSNGFVDTTGSVTCNFTSDYLDGRLSSYGLSHYYVFACPYTYRTGRSFGSMSVYMFFASAADIDFDFSVATGSIPYLTITASSTSDIYFTDSRNVGFSIPNPNGGSVAASGSFNIGNVGLSNKGLSYTVVGRNAFSSSNTYYLTCVYSNGVGAVVPPAGDWPEDEPIVNPTAPVVPEPDDETPISEPVVVPPSVTFPDIDITITDNSPEETTPEDYTPWLRAINENLNSLRSDLLVEFDAIKTSIRNIYTYLQHLDDLLENHCVHLRNQIITSTNHLESYLQGLFEWLGQQLDFSLDDTELIIWLKRIYTRLGDTGTYQPNPIVDPGGFFDWLAALLGGWIAGLVSGLPAKLQELVSDITDLTNYFPFSAPWDVYALLALFAHEPVIPVFTIPWGFGGGRTVDIVVDCTQWDGIMTIVRAVEKIIFAGGLAMLTFRMFKPTDVTGD